MFTIPALKQQHLQAIQQKIDNKTKPLGALGTLESLAAQIALVQLSKHSTDIHQHSLVIQQPHLLVFAGDHGIASEGVSIAPSDVTSQMVANFAHGGAAINVFCRQFDWQLQVVDAGILHAPEMSLAVVDQRLGATTAAFHLQPALTSQQLEQAFLLAPQLVKKIAATGCNLIAFGEMGIGNTTSASAIMSAAMQLTPADTVGKGTGVSEQIVLRKQQLIAQALALHSDDLTDAMSILRCLGGFEIAQITAAMLAAAEQGMLIVVDGFICTACAMLAIKINSASKDYMIFAHCSGEQGHQKMLDWLQVTPLLDLGLRLGEGTGAALALPIIQAAVGFYNDMASFADAEVTDVT